jgi:hypothetical protein
VFFSEEKNQKTFMYGWRNMRDLAGNVEPAGK